MFREYDARAVAEIVFRSSVRAPPSIRHSAGRTMSGPPRVSRLSRVSGAYRLLMSKPLKLRSCPPASTLSQRWMAVQPKSHCESAWAPMLDEVANRNRDSTLGDGGRLHFDLLGGLRRNCRLVVGVAIRLLLPTCS